VHTVLNRNLNNLKNKKICERENKIFNLINENQKMSTFAVPVRTKTKAKMDLDTTMNLVHPEW
jgi:hypothetical protein